MRCYKHDMEEYSTVCSANEFVSENIVLCFLVDEYVNKSLWYETHITTPTKLRLTPLCCQRLWNLPKSRLPYFIIVWLKRKYFQSVFKDEYSNEGECICNISGVYSVINTGLLNLGRCHNSCFWANDSTLI